MKKQVFARRGLIDESPFADVHISTAPRERSDSDGQKLTLIGSLVVRDRSKRRFLLF
jgi:hypothetical protein